MPRSSGVRAMSTSRLVELLVTVAEGYGERKDVAAELDRRVPIPQAPREPSRQKKRKRKG